MTTRARRKKRGAVQHYHIYRSMTSLPCTSATQFEHGTGFIVNSCNPHTRQTARDGMSSAKLFPTKTHKKSRSTCICASYPFVTPFVGYCCTIVYTQYVDVAPQPVYSPDRNNAKHEHKQQKHVAKPFRSTSARQLPFRVRTIYLCCNLIFKNNANPETRNAYTYYKKASCKSRPWLQEQKQTPDKKK